MSIIKSQVETEITPEIAAKAFAHFASDEQADFFEHLAKEVRSTYGNSYSLGEMQWLYMHDDLKKRGGDAWEMYHAVSAFAYEFSQEIGALKNRGLS